MLQHILLQESRASSRYYSQCIEQEDTTDYGCTAWQEQRTEHARQVTDVSVENLVGKMLESPGNWKIIDAFIRCIMKRKKIIGLAHIP